MYLPDSAPLRALNGDLKAKYDIKGKILNQSLALAQPKIDA
jgi:hypothetical protein